jgi:hypothetical protein
VAGDVLRELRHTNQRSRAHLDMCVRRRSTWRGARGRALQRGHDVAARHASVHFGFAQVGRVFLPSFELRCTMW